MLGAIILGSLCGALLIAFPKPFDDLSQAAEDVGESVIAALRLRDILAYIEKKLT